MPTKKIIYWLIEDCHFDNGSFKVKPRLVLVYSDETCTFFASENAIDYVNKIDEMFKEGLQGNLIDQRSRFKALAEIQRLLATKKAKETKPPAK